MLEEIMPGTRMTIDMPRPDSASDKSYGSLQHFLRVNRLVRIGILNNPLSGGNRNGLQKIRDAASGVRPDVLQREVQTPSDVAAALAEFARQEINIVVVNGGDGTVQAALTAIFHKNLFETMPVLAVLRSAGTTSMIAGDVGLKGSRESALHRLFEWTDTRDSNAVFLPRSVLRVQVQQEKEPVYGMFFGAAAIFQASHFCHQKIHARGVRGEKAAGAALARFLVAALLKDRKVISAVPIMTRLDQKSAEQQNYLLILVTTLHRLFLGLRPYWGSEPGPLHYTAIAENPRHFMRSLPSLMRGRHGRYITPDNGYISHNIDEVQLTLNSGFNLDGELYTPDCKQEPVVVTHGGQASFLQL